MVQELGALWAKSGEVTYGSARLTTVRRVAYHSDWALAKKSNTGSSLSGLRRNRLSYGFKRRWMGSGRCCSANGRRAGKPVLVEGAEDCEPASGGSAQADDPFGRYPRGI